MSMQNIVILSVAVTLVAIVVIQNVTGTKDKDLGL